MCTTKAVRASPECPGQGKRLRCVLRACNVICVFHARVLPTPLASLRARAHAAALPVEGSTASRRHARAGERHSEASRGEAFSPLRLLLPRQPPQCNCREHLKRAAGQPSQRRQKQGDVAVCSPGPALSSLRASSCPRATAGLELASPQRMGHSVATAGRLCHPEASRSHRAGGRASRSVQLGALALLFALAAMPHRCAGADFYPSTTIISALSGPSPAVADSSVLTASSIWGTSRTCSSNPSGHTALSLW